MKHDLTPRERELARRALWLDGRHKRSYRNHYVVGNTDDYAAWRDIEQRGLAKSWLTMGTPMVCFRLTRAGALAALEEGEEIDEGEFPR